jgi:hypothetical protein
MCPHYVALVWAAQKTPLPMIPVLLYVDTWLQKRVYQAIA